MYCPNCGTQINEGASKCNNCGYEFWKDDFLAKELNLKRGNTATPIIKSVNDKIQIKRAMIGISVISIVLMVLPWVTFVGKLDVSYNLFTLPRFAVDGESFLYWVLYDIWDHKGVRQFAAFAKMVRTFAIIMVIFHGANIFSLLKEHPLQKTITVATGLWSLVTSLYYTGWMFWFKSALMKYNDYSMRDVFHFTMAPYIAFIITLSLFSLSFKKFNPKYDVK